MGREYTYIIRKDLIQLLGGLEEKLGKVKIVKIQTIVEDIEYHTIELTNISKVLIHPTVSVMSMNLFNYPFK